MATNPYVNKVVYGNQTVMDISDTTAEEANVSSGEVFYKADGARSVGTADYYSPSDTAETTIDDADYFPYYDTSATAKRKSLWSNIKSVLKTYFVSLFVIEKTKVQYDALPSADKNDPDKVYYVPDYEDTSKTWVRLDDSTTANDKVWSSSKIATELSGVAEIDDTTTSATKAWSSNKIQTVINSKLAYSENDTTGTVIDDADFVPYYDYSESARQKITFANIKAKLKTYFDSLYAAISHTHTKSQITDFPTLGTAASKDVPASGNASSSQVVIGSDTRLTDARTPTSHTHTKSEITDFPTLGSAAALDVPSSGDASSSEVVKGDDTRLTDARTPTSHTHTVSDISDMPDVDEVEQVVTDTGSQSYRLLFSDSSISTTETGVTRKSQYLTYTPTYREISVKDANNSVWTIPQGLAYEMHRGITSASAGDTVRFPANGTDSHITNNVAIIPLAEPKSDGTPLKYSSIAQYNGYVVITLAEGFTSLTGIGILVYDRTQRS